MTLSRVRPMRVTVESISLRSAVGTETC